METISLPGTIAIIGEYLNQLAICVHALDLLIGFNAP